MITPPYLRTMAAYNTEMNRRLYTAAAHLTDAERRADQGAFWGSIHGTFSHLLWADQMWMSRFAGWPTPTNSRLRDSAEPGDSFETLAADRKTADAGIESWAGTVRQDWLDGETGWFSGSTQRDLRASTAGLVMHMFNHQTHHRGQAHALLTRHGLDTGDTDLWLVLPEDRSFIRSGG